MANLDLCRPPANLPGEAGQVAIPRNTTFEHQSIALRLVDMLLYLCSTLPHSYTKPATEPDLTRAGPLLVVDRQYYAARAS